LGRGIRALRGGLELDRAQEQMPRGLIRLTCERTPSRFLERARRLAGEISRRRAVELCKQRRSVVEVVRSDLEQLVSGPLPEPLGEARVMLGARRLREARVRDVADEDVLEAVGRLVLQ